MIRCMGCMAEIEEDQRRCPYCGYEQGAEVKEAYYLLPGKILGKKYIVGKVLGYGGFGVTYIGWDAELERKVAIKEYLPSNFSTRSYGAEKLTVFSGEATIQFQAGLESFVSEAKRLARFNRIPEIVDIYDCFMENDTGYIIMEFLEGETVKEILKREKKIPYQEAERIMVSVLDGLSQIHKEGIIHRDIAPDNIFITKEGKVKILDFGAARYATAVQSRSLSVILKPGYAPEEQYRSRGKQGPWTDVYAAGAVFYRMITGIRPSESIERNVNDNLKMPSELGIEIPQSVENALMNSLNVKREYRIQDAETFCRVLRKEEDAERIIVEKEREELSKIPLHTKVMAGVAAGIAVVFIVLAATGTIGLTNKKIQSTTGKAVLSKNECYVPDVSGMSYKKAKDKLEELGLKVVINGMNYSETIKKNKILSQSPRDGEIVQKKATITVVMSGGKEEIMMPDLEGMTYEKAKKLIKAQNLVLDKKAIKKEYNDFVEKGRIVSQNIKADKRISPKTKVSFVVSLGKLSEETAELTVPDLTGLTKDEAIEKLQQLKDREGFTYTIGDITKEHSTEVEKGRIIRQGLESGSKVRTDKPITLVISEGPEKVVMPNVVYKEQDDAKQDLQSLGLNVNIETEYSSKVAKGCVISQSREEGTEADKGSTVTLVVSMGGEPERMNTAAPSQPETPTTPSQPETSATPAQPESPAPELKHETEPKKEDDIEVLPSDEDIVVY